MEIEEEFSHKVVKKSYKPKKRRAKKTRFSKPVKKKVKVNEDQFENEFFDDRVDEEDEQK